MKRENVRNIIYYTPRNKVRNQDSRAGAAARDRAARLPPADPARCAQCTIGRVQQYLPGYL